MHNIHDVYIYTWLAVKAWVHLFSGKRVFNCKWYKFIYGSRLKRGYIVLVEKCWLFMSIYIYGLNMYIGQAVICTCILLQYIRCAIPLPSYFYLLLIWRAIVMYVLLLNPYIGGILILSCIVYLRARNGRLPVATLFEFGYDQPKHNLQIFSKGHIRCNKFQQWYAF